MADLIAMLGAAAGAAAGGGEVDPYFNQTTLLLHGDGTNGAQNNTFLDSSTNTFTITRNGNTTQGTFSPFSVAAGEWSNYFDGVDDYLQCDTALDAINTTTHPFTIDFWIYPLVDLTPTNINPFGINNSSNGDNIFLYFGDAVSINNSTTNLSSYPLPNEWTFVQIIYDGSTVTVYHNGVSAGSVNSVTFNVAFSSCNFGIAAEFDAASGGTPGNYFNGYFSNFRVLDVATTQSVPTAPSTDISGTTLLTCRSNRFVDNSGTPKSISVFGNPSVQPFSPFAPSAAYSPSVNGGSGYFDGTGDYLSSSFSSTSLFNGNATFEAWVYLNSVSGQQAIFRENTTGTGFNFGTNGTALQIDDTANAPSIFATSSGVIRANEWTYIAVTRSSNTFTIYVNGVSVGTNSSIYTYFTGNASGFLIGTLNGTNNMLNGYLANARVSDITRSISLPTSLQTSDGDTVTLLNFTNAGIFDNTGKNNLETVGNAQIDTTTKKYGTGSMEFDGTGDYLVAPSSPNSILNGDFTIECWIYRNSGNNYFFTLGDSFLSTGIDLYIGNSGSNLRLYSGDSVVIDVSLASISFPTTTWTHIAIVRSSGSVKLYADGAQAGSAWSSTTTFSGKIYIGAEFYNGSITGDCDGFIDDLRITKGVARYTANFTPPTKAFPDL